MWLSLDGLFSFVTSSMSISPTSYPSGITGRLNGVETLNVASFGCPSPHLANCVLILTLSWGTVAERDPWGSVVNHLMESGWWEPLPYAPMSLRLWTASHSPEPSLLRHIILWRARYSTFSGRNWSFHSSLPSLDSATSRLYVSVVA